MSGDTLGTETINPVPASCHPNTAKGYIQPPAQRLQTSLGGVKPAAYSYCQHSIIVAL